MLLPDLNCELQISVGAAQWDLALAVEVRQCPCQRRCQNRCQIECQNECLNRCQIVCQNRCQNRCPNRCQNRCHKYVQMLCQNPEECVKVGTTRRNYFWDDCHYITYPLQWSTPHLIFLKFCGSFLCNPGIYIYIYIYTYIYLYLCVPPFILSIWPIHELRWIYQTWSSWIIATRVSQILRPLNVMVLNMLPTREICDTRWDLFKKSLWKQMQVYKPQYEVNLNMWNICYFFVHIHPFPILFSTVNPPCVGA